MKKILIIQGHPDKESYCYALAKAYRQGAEASGSEVRVINTGELDFNPNLAMGYRKRTNLEPCLEKAQRDILWAEHIVVVYPVWWGMAPAVLKGFLDRVFLPGFAFNKRPNSLWWDKLLKGRTARIITTMDQPTLYYRLVYGRPSTRAIKNLTLEFCGIKPVKTTSIGPIRMSSDRFREKWLEKIETLGRKMD
ncbi:NAD(P)H-dependent oxidoreductase [Cytophagaceae bacterium ABcell3]|nr:NAD(P)H-dependent oxidoreductase [Cytophagaceae bacterium ABcell3]